MTARNQKYKEETATALFTRIAEYNLKEKVDRVHFRVFPLQETLMRTRNIRIIPTLTKKENSGLVSRT